MAEVGVVEEGEQDVELPSETALDGSEEDFIASDMIVRDLVGTEKLKVRKPIFMERDMPPLPSLH